MSNQHETILLAEDNEDDVFLMRRALKKANIVQPLQVAMDGQEALDYLSAAGKFADRLQHPLPSLVFLDLKLPYVHGFEVLEWVRERDALKHIPIVVLTSSPEERDRQRAHDLGARAYFVKPPTSETLLQAMRFWKSNSPNETAAAGRTL